MKKYILFFAVFLLSGILVAQEALSESSKDEFSAYYDRFFVQPTAGIGIVYFDIDINVALDVLVKRFDSGHGIYVGAEGGFRYQPAIDYGSYDVEPVTEFPIMGNIVFDFKTPSKNGLPEYASLWLSFGYSRMLIVPDPAESGEKSWCNSMSWGIGTALTFKNRVVLKMGVNGISVIIPTLTLAVGYRF